MLERGSLDECADKLVEKTEDAALSRELAEPTVINGSVGEVTPYCCSSSSWRVALDAPPAFVLPLPPPTEVAGDSG